MTNFRSQVDSSEILARLLSAERITMIKSNVSTASFDIKNRILYLPNWQDMSNEEEIMLVLHEMSHALFTTQEEYTEVFNKYAHIKSYCNVIEDARVEILMKDRYPGSRRQFLQGYVSLYKRDFFGVKDVNFKSLLPIDRLNLHYKIGALHQIPLSPAEVVFSERMISVKSIQEVIDLAQEIYEYTKKEIEESEEDQLENNVSGNEPSDDPEEQESPSSSSSSKEKSKSDDPDNTSKQSEFKSDKESDEESDQETGLGNTQAQPPLDLDSKTDKNFYSNLEDLADTQTIINYVRPVPAHPESFDDVIVSYKTIVSHFSVSSKVGETYPGYYVTEPAFKIKKSICNKFRRQNANFISYMVKEFEMKKAATAFKKTQIAKSGNLDMNKLYAYKIKDELFKTTQKLQKEKNHGMIFLLDWSGSMDPNMSETLQQCISLASFCHRLQIPFQVLAFTDLYSTPNKRKRKFNYTDDFKNKDGFVSDNFHLLEFFSHKMSVTEFNLVSDFLLSKFYRKSLFLNYSLGGTPLNSAMLYMVDHVGKFKAENSVEKMSLILLSDGEGGNLPIGPDVMRDSMTPFDNSPRKVIVRDPVTGKQYAISNQYNRYSSVCQVGVFNKIIKDRHNAKVVKFFLTNCQSGDRNFAYAAAARFLSSTDPEAFVKKSGDDYCSAVAKQITSNTFGFVKNANGYDEAYVIDANTKIVELEDYLESMKSNDIDDSTQNKDVSTVAKAFSDGLTHAKKSRVLLGRFIELIS